MAKGKEVVAKEASNLPAAPMAAWGSENITSEDILVPRLMLMQPMSEFVTSGECKMGDIIESLDHSKVLGSEKKPAELIVFGSFKTWRIEHDGEYHKTVPWGPENAKWAYEEVVEDIAVTRDLVQNYYALSVEDIAKGEAFPYVIAFKRTSMNTAKALGAHLMKLQAQNKPSAAKVFKLTSKKETNDKGTFFVFEVAPGRDTTEQEMATTYKWYQQLAKATVRVDEEETPTAEHASQPKAARTVNDLTV